MRFCYYKLLLLVAVGFGYCQSALGQGAFQNLDFEKANTTPIPDNSYYPYAVYPTNALPGWSVFYGTTQQTQITYNDISTGSTAATLISANDPNGPNAIEGNFGVFLQGGSTATDVSIQQTGLVPALTESILFKAEFEGPNSLSLGGQNIPFVALGTGANYTLYGGNIPSTLAGQIEQLEFSVPEGPGGNNAWNLDSIVFSPSAVPEPATWALFTSGICALAIWRKRTV